MEKSIKPPFQSEHLVSKILLEVGLVNWSEGLFIIGDESLY